MKRALSSLLCLLLLSACGFPVRDRHLVGRWRLMAPDTDEQTCLLWDWADGSGPCVISSTVFAVGYDDKYIVAENHPGEVKNRTAYWYIIRDPKTEKEREGISKARVMGPFSEKQFGELKDGLHLPNFSITYDGLR